MQDCGTSCARRTCRLIPRTRQPTLLPWRRQHEARLTIVHVAERAEDAKTDDQERDFEARFRAYLPGELPHNWTFRTQLGPIDQTILDLADMGRVDLIVLGVRASHSFAHPHGWPHAYKVACEAACPVLTLRCGKEPQA